MLQNTNNTTIVCLWQFLTLNFFQTKCVLYQFYYETIDREDTTETACVWPVAEIQVNCAVQDEKPDNMSCMLLRCHDSGMKKTVLMVHNM